MKAVILAGGYGTRLAEKTDIRPKPMVKIGKRPILWHIMKIYAQYEVTDFIICCGYKGYVIKDYFLNYHLRHADLEVDLKENSATFLNNNAEPWTVNMVDTGDGTMTGGRLKRVSHLLDDEPFFFTYGDGGSNIDIQESLEFHRNHGMLATMTAVQPSGRFGTFRLEDDQKRVRRFREKPQEDDAWINGGFFVLSPEVIEYIDGDGTVWERDRLERLAQDRQLAAYRHTGFWHPMDTLKDKKLSAGGENLLFLFLGVALLLRVQDAVSSAVLAVVLLVAAGIAAVFDDARALAFAALVRFGLFDHSWQAPCQRGFTPCLRA